MGELIAEGAEAKIFLDVLKSDSSKSIVVKDRILKSYRHPLLDSFLRRSRTKRECKILLKARECGVNVPFVHNSSLGDNTLFIEFLDGDKLSLCLNSYDLSLQLSVMEGLGRQVALLHENNIIHGDLTTSNVLFCDGEPFIIDFGLGFISRKIEDMAVDLHLIKQALEAKHFMNFKDLFSSFTKGYKWSNSSLVMDRLVVVEKRGRYKH